MRLATTVLGVLVAACGAANQPAAPAPPPNRCNEVLTAAVERVYAAGSATNPRDNLEAIMAVKVRRCVADTWPDAAIDCAAHAGTIPDLRDCRAKLATDQANALAAQESQIKDDWEQELAGAKSLRDRMCACADRACAVAVDKEASTTATYRRQHHHAQATDPTPPHDVGERIDSDAREMHECAMRLHASPMEEAIAKMQEFSDKMCTCKDTACAQKVSDEMMKWGQDNARSWDRDVKPTEDETKRMVDITKQMTDCMTKAMGAGGTP
ncbi:MAG TPA: hypothetical protein VMJ10_27735 [Kofleriaceae bacterium]|nr:hypothetical protein [Kofleriaceae bacterium]